MDRTNVRASWLPPPSAGSNETTKLGNDTHLDRVRALFVAGINNVDEARLHLSWLTEYELQRAPPGMPLSKETIRAIILVNVANLSGQYGAKGAHLKELLREAAT